MLKSGVGRIRQEREHLGDFVEDLGRFTAIRQVRAAQMGLKKKVCAELTKKQYGIVL